MEATQAEAASAIKPTITYFDYTSLLHKSFEGMWQGGVSNPMAVASRILGDKAYIFVAVVYPVGTKSHLRNIEKTFVFSRQDADSLTLRVLLELHANVCLKQETLTKYVPKIKGLKTQQINLSVKVTDCLKQSSTSHRYKLMLIRQPERSPWKDLPFQHDFATVRKLRDLPVEEKAAMQVAARPGCKS